LDQAQQTGLERIKMVPGNKALLTGIVAIDEMDAVDLEQLLGRDAVSIDTPELVDLVRNRTVLVTGASGSIGSEICRQVARLEPSVLLLIDQDETGIYDLHREIAYRYPKVRVKQIVGDVRDAVRIDGLFELHLPDVVFHAAAYKHLPILQTQIREAFRNNVLGTTRLAEVAERLGVGTFVLISTDKAVNPTNIMGATKRVAEMYCQNMNARSNTRFITVRFGNVLNSNGSVVPLFQEQIAKGGPVTVTHPEISRYFMTISEASQLIMQAAVLGSGGEIYVLDMGEPMKITYLAEQMIRLAGKEPGRDIQIIYTGLRPGEKLYEELFHELEPYDTTTHEKIFLAHPRQVDWDELRSELRNIEIAVRRYDTESLQHIMLRLVPELAKSSINVEPPEVISINRPG